MLAIDDDTPAALREVERQALGKGFKTAVRGGHAANAENAKGGSGLVHAWF
jgi:hypothetical protein